MKKIRLLLIRLIQAFTIRIQLKSVPKFITYIDQLLFRSNEKYIAYNNLPIYINHEVSFHCRNIIHHNGFEVVKIFELFLKKGDVYIDVGGNLGYLALNAEKIVGKEGKVISLEPDTTILPLLKKNKDLNNSAMTIIEKAAGKKKGTVSFNVATESGLSRLENKGENLFGLELLKKIEVKMDTLDSIVTENLSSKKVNFIKVDVEGHELSVLQGSKDILEQSGPTLVLEMNHKAMKQNGDTLADIMDFLRPYNYQFYRINTYAAGWFRVGRNPSFTPIIKGDEERFLSFPFDILCINPKSTPQDLSLDIQQKIGR